MLKKICIIKKCARLTDGGEFCIKHCQIKKCEQCNKEYIKNIRGRTPRYCSSGCRIKSALVYPNQEWRREKKCRYCNNLFLPITPGQYLCSKKCSNSFNSFEYKAKNGGLGGWEKLRFEVFKRDNFTCRYCGRNVEEDGIKLHCDHINPRKNGGQNILDNLKTSCQECNLGKSDVLL